MANTTQDTHGQPMRIANPEEGGAKGEVWAFIRALLIVVAVAAAAAYFFFM
ncbi:hypothetical protein [Rhodovarius crocodyli]|uniref:hypothetical protein n=1 Tax=Rhodovarius crocodyli TaxID=1979269 RepID=UPI0013E2FC5E|nr:hypothetical protein [Rhodovarius crocodyli]